jgi:uncharacterized protein
MSQPVTSATPSTGLDALRARLGGMGPLVVAFSGGADSAFLAWVATDTLGRDQVRCVTAVSPSLAREELADCRTLAAEWDLDLTEVTTDELADPAYSSNDGSRCYHCKSSLMDALAPMADPDRGGRLATVVLGVNLDDLGDHRPGQQAAAERGARFPLVEAGLTKADVRSWSRWLGLRTWDKPAAACLASRVPYGTPVSLRTLGMVADAESGLRSLGFTQLRVRHYGDTARIEVPTEDLAAVVDRHRAVSDAVHRAGYRYVTLDLDGFRSGNLNQALSVGASEATGQSPQVGQPAVPAPVPGGRR